jgi:hypothetical protein
MASYVELYVDQGTTFNNVINITDDLTNDYVNVSGYTVTSQLRRSYYSANASANITCTITDPPNGEITLSMTAANTALIKAGRYLFDVRTVDRASITSRIVEGIITITPRVTQ